MIRRSANLGIISEWGAEVVENRRHYDVPKGRQMEAVEVTCRETEGPAEGGRERNSGKNSPGGRLRNECPVTTGHFSAFLEGIQALYPIRDHKRPT